MVNYFKNTPMELFVARHFSYVLQVTLPIPILIPFFYNKTFK